MGLKRKPRVGETLLARNGEKLVVHHFDTSQPAIVHLTTSQGVATSAIWWFERTREFNQYLSHEE